MSILRRRAIVPAMAVGALLAVGHSIYRMGRPQSPEARPDFVEAGCHDLRRLFVDGATRISALFGVEIVADHRDWPEVTEALELFAQERGWSLQDESQMRPGVVETLAINICAPDQPVLVVNEIYWLFRPEVIDGVPIPPRSPAIRFVLYGDAPESVWQPVAADMVAMLETRWANRVRFRDENSYLTDRRPAFLKPKL